MQSGYLGSYALEEKKPLSMNDPSALKTDKGKSLLSDDAKSAGIQVAGSMLSSYLAAKAEEEMNRRKMLAQSAQNQGDMMNKAMNTAMGSYASALR